MSSSTTTPETMAVEPFTIAHIASFVLRWPVARPVQTSFGTMHDRPAVLVRLETTDGAVGWGEIWCNFPACGAEHRARLLETVVAPLVVGQTFHAAEAAFQMMSQRTAVLAIQTGEPGPLAQVCAGVDLAVWDMLARRADVPLWKLLGGSSGAVAVYASGINPDQPEAVVAAKAAQGYRAFKLKIGFGEARDLANVKAVRDQLPSGGAFMVDANQAWDLPTAQRQVQLLSEYAPAWVEEPLRADRPLAEWKALAASSDLALAAGENLIGVDALETMIASGALGVVQPDVAKWGGISACLPVIERIHEAGQRFCPHFLGAGIGQMASAHVLAARGRPGGMLEVDANDNPLRTELSPALATVHEGVAQLGDAPGLGAQPDIQRLRELCQVKR